MILSPFERMMAFRYLRARRQEGFISIITFISLLGIMLGVATLIIVMSVMNGFRAELHQQVIGLNGHMNVFSAQGPMTEYDDLAARLRQLPHVTSVNAVIEGQGLITGRGSPRGVMIRGIDPEAFRTKPILSQKIVRGEAASFGDTNIAIGRRLASMLGVEVGDTLTLVSPQGRATAFGMSPRFASYTIAAIYDVGMYQFDANYIYMPLPAAQTFFRMDGRINALEVFAADLGKVSDVKDDIITSESGLVRVLDWKEQNASFTNALEVERNVMFLILSLMTGIAALNIISGLYMLVTSKSRDIAIMRTMGATRGMVLRIFMLTGSSIGIIGTLLGLGAGIAFAENIDTIKQWLESLSGAELFSPEIYFFSRLPAIIDYAEVTQVAVLALSLSFLATIYPAWRAARLDPVEALRYE
jgi:lipoprotein-releasing system permease protein